METDSVCVPPAAPPKGPGQSTHKSCPIFGNCKPGEKPCSNCIRRERPECEGATREGSVAPAKPAVNPKTTAQAVKAVGKLDAKRGVPDGTSLRTAEKLHGAADGWPAQVAANLRDYAVHDGMVYGE